MRYLYILFLLSLFMTTGHGTVYDGPKSPGIEYFEVGNYKVKGLIKCNKNWRCRLLVYPETSREYTMFLQGEIFQNLKLKDGYYLVDILVQESGLGENKHVLVVDKPKSIQQLSIMKKTVQQIK